MLACLLLPQLALGQQATLHQGPSLHIHVQRGNERLPLKQVPNLKSGDVVEVQVIEENLAPGDWVLMVASSSATGTDIQSSFFDVRKQKQPATLNIGSDGLALIIVLAPQLRNLFGLNTSLSESSSILKDVLSKDPQRFFDLQRVDQLNQAISVIGQSLLKRLGSSTPASAKQITLDWARQFGVNQIENQCFIGGDVNTMCVAQSIVSNKNFSLPSTNDLSAIVGVNKSVGLNDLLTTNLKFFSDAGEYLGSKYRDTYDFAPTYGQREANSDRINLYSVARLRSDKVKTAYIFVPSWFSEPPPSLQFNPLQHLCLNSELITWRPLGKVPFMDYWHGWNLDIQSDDRTSLMAHHFDVRFNLDEGWIRYTLPKVGLEKLPRDKPLALKFSAKFGFENYELPLIEAALPFIDAEELKAQLQGLDQWIAGSTVEVKFKSVKQAACIERMAILKNDEVLGITTSNDRTHLQVKLDDSSIGNVKLEVSQIGGQKLSIPNRIETIPASIEKVVHHQGEKWVRVEGKRLHQLKEIRIGNASCFPIEGERSNAKEWRFDCKVGNPDELSTTHVKLTSTNASQLEQQHVLKQASALPRVRLAEQVKYPVLIAPSPKFKQWNLSLDSEWVSDDSGISVLLAATPPYRLKPGIHVLQLRFKDDPLTNERPISAALIVDPSHNELRTRSPIRFDPAKLPGVLNPLEFRVVNLTIGEQSEWTALNKSVVLLPDLLKQTCSRSTEHRLIHGQNLDLIDHWILSSEDSENTVTRLVQAQLTECESGLCQELPKKLNNEKVRVSLRWLKDQYFTVKLPEPSIECAPVELKIEAPGNK